MIRIEFTAPDSSRVTAEGAPGDNLLRLGQAKGLPLEGTCEGQMACSTCHVIVDPAWFDRLPAASEAEEDMLDLAANACRTSRLSCQIDLTADLDGLAVRVPPDSHDARRI
ncbi:2Fe-2S iron-sulfur cluster-binding protein [Tsuneonella sp. SYSU-LHT278]|uniref:2Fe-2S iron-sulfur cluster-binding protein n=1 Tax=Tsuneonella sediminis TaxID=3416089 RepID=UPI003F7B314F